MRLKIAGFKIHASIVLGVLSLASLAAYASLRSAVLGAAAFVLLVGAVAADLFFGGDAPLGARGTGGRRTGARGGKRGKSEWRKPVFEIGVTLSVAVAAWLALCFALQTSTPLNVVTSCSMLPALERGDFIILQGGGVKAREAAVPFTLGGAETKPVVLDARQQGKRYYFAYSTFLPAGAGAGAAQSSFANYSFADCARVPLGGGEAGELEAGGLEACASGVEVNGVFFPRATTTTG